MKNWIAFGLMALVLLAGCKDDEDDTPQEPANTDFIGTYEVIYEGSGALGQTNDTTTAKVSEGDQDDMVNVEVDLELVADILGSQTDLPLGVEVQGYVVDNTYFIPRTSITSSVNVSGLPIDIDLIFELDGELTDPNTLISNLTLSGTLSGSVEMTGTKQ